MNYYNETRTHLSLDKDAPLSARFREQGVFFVFQSWAGCITNMFGFDLRQAQRDQPTISVRPCRHLQPLQRPASPHLSEDTRAFRASAMQTWREVTALLRDRD